MCLPPDQKKYDPHPPKEYFLFKKKNFLKTNKNKQISLCVVLYCKLAGYKCKVFKMMSCLLILLVLFHLPMTLLPYIKGHNNLINKALLPYISRKKKHFCLIIKREKELLPQIKIY